tara:strand:+ start:137 stop:463 length:327 start_codon:yes stop_codon:yes gene_type:complete
MDNAAFGRVVRSELTPIMKHSGFNISITTQKSYYGDGEMSLMIKKVPSNFQVFLEEYNRWDFTENAEKLVETIRGRIDKLMSKHQVDVRLSINWDGSIKYIKNKKEEN